MKKFLCTILALVMLLSCIMSLSGCFLVVRNNTSSPEHPSDIAGRPEIPAGYQGYTDGTITFAFPKNWDLQDGSTVILRDATTGNNITVVSEPKTDMYEKMTLESFNSDLKPLYEAAGLSLSNVKISKTTTNGLSVVKLSHDTVAYEVNMKQTAYISTIGNKTYTVTVTEVVEDSKLVSTVLDTLCSVE